MTLEEIKTKLASIRASVGDLAMECYDLYQESDDHTNTQQIADYLYYELTAISTHLADLEETEEDDDPVAEQEELNELEDWWDNLDCVDQSEIANVPMPTCDDGGRGDNYYAFKERVNKWWRAQTLQRKREIFDEHTDWWDVD